MTSGVASEPGAPYRGAVRTLVVATAAIASIVLLGWTFHIEPMKRIVAGLTSMNPMTAVCFECSSLALWLIHDRPAQGGRRLWVSLPALFVLCVGASKILDLATGTSLCPDDVLFVSQLNYGQAYPSRMAPNVAASFALLGVALLATDRRGWPGFLHPQWLITPIFAAALAALIGYAYDTTGFYKYRQYIPMALHSAVCFVLSASALLLSRPEQGYLKLIPRGSSGARNFSRALPACVGIPALLGGLQLYATDHGWLTGPGMGTAIVCVLTIIALAVLAFINSAALNRAETIRREAEIRLKHQATHDPLTGLPNRLLFVDRLQHAIARAVRQDISCALFYIDIDNFKPVNDRHGHQAGDELLRSLAGRLRQVTREADTVARLGGDEFAIIMDTPSNVDEVLLLARRVSNAVVVPHVLILPGAAMPLEVLVGISIGVAIFPGHASDLDTLVRIADHAMYRAKIDGKNHHRLASIEVASAA